MTSCLSSKGSGKAAAGGREEGITPGGSTHADQKTGRQGILPPGAPEVAKKKINRVSWFDKCNRKFDDSGDDVINDEDEEMKKA